MLTPTQTGSDFQKKIVSTFVDKFLIVDQTTHNKGRFVNRIID